MQRRYVIVDVFTDKPFEGNALAVFTNPVGLDDATMQRIAREMNLSETSFVLPSEAEGQARVRIFTPRRELPFAGHPIIGTAWVIGGSVQLARLELETGVGIITVDLERSDGLRRATMSQLAPVFEDVDPAPFRAALGLTGEAPETGAATVADNGFRCALVRATLDDLLQLTPDLAAVERLDGIVTCAVWAVDGQGIKTRVFAPAAGIGEDPATGSAAGPLAAQAVRLGLLPAGPINVRQGIEMGRPSLLEVHISEAGDVHVGGSCVVMGRGFLEL